MAALPGDGGENRAPGRPEAGVVVADEEFDAGEAAELEAGEELAPMDLGLAEGDADAEDGAFAVGADAQGDEDGTVDEVAAVTNLLVAGVDENLGSRAEGTLAPESERGI